MVQNHQFQVSAASAIEVCHDKGMYCQIGDEEGYGRHSGYNQECKHQYTAAVFLLESVEQGFQPGLSAVNASDQDCGQARRDAAQEPYENKGRRWL